jgi:hypothetical protein
MERDRSTCVVSGEADPVYWKINELPDGVSTADVETAHLLPVRMFKFKHEEILKVSCLAFSVRLY